VAPGPVTVSLTVNDGDTTAGCAALQTVAISCTAGFRLDASPTDLGPGQTTGLHVASTDGAAHPQASYASSDGLDALQTGVFAPPPSFWPVFTEMVVRYGSRGLSSLKYDAATLAMWQRAQTDGIVSSMAANQQWDVFRDATGKLLVRLLYDEKEIDFKPSCAGARYTPDGHWYGRFYEYAALKACYGH
jgi:hypothetical protein